MDATFPISGRIQVQSQSYISHGANGGGGGISANRGFNISGYLSGSGNMVIMNAGTAVPQQITGATNTYSGPMDCAVRLVARKRSRLPWDEQHHC